LNFIAYIRGNKSNIKKTEMPIRILCGNVELLRENTIPDFTKYLFTASSPKSFPYRHALMISLTSMAYASLLIKDK